jgi:pSer/pThr/pTyr-binding forkhead associated (FHA) protein
MSSNGVFVNGERVRGSQRLARADVIRVGGDEFRFHADMPVPGAPTLPNEDGAPSVASMTPADSSSLEDTAPTPASLPDAPVSAATDSDDEVRPALVTLEVLNEGLSKGNRYTIRTPLAHVGRGAHNDVRLTDESVSETHAKLQRRDDGWYAVDMNSTNGTYVGGSRVTGERRIDGAPDVRFGGVKLRFLPAGMPVRALDATGTDRQKPMPRSTPIPNAITETAAGGNGVRWALLALAIVAAVFFVLRGRA